MTQTKSLSLSLLLMAALIAGEAGAADAPKRKSGLWEMKTQMSGMPAAMPERGPIQMCVDQASDNMMQERAKEKSNCSVMDVNRSAGKITIHSVCKYEDTTTTSDAVITGDMDSNYKNDMTIKYSPPRDGLSTMKITQEARWLGPCKAGQKPGDIMMPGMPAMNPANMQQMMKDPKFQEMMRQQHQQK
jgi:hypothetical protein